MYPQKPSKDGKEKRPDETHTHDLALSFFSDERQHALE